MSIRIVTDSSCDLPQSMVDELKISIVPLSIRFGDEEFIVTSTMSLSILHFDAVNWFSLEEIWW